MKPEFIVAVKEFKDYLSSWRFLLIFAVLILMSIAAIVAGVGNYNTQLATYNAELTRAASSNNGGFQPTLPSMMLVFSSFSSLFVIGGWLLAIGIGFDLISKEKETGSLKLLLARPIFRDSIINGKILGSSSILIVSLLATFLISFAILLFEGITPSGDDLLRLVTFFVMLVLFCLTFLAIAIAASAVAKNSTIAILLAIGIVVFGLLLPYFSSSVSSIVLGSAPPITLTTAGSSQVQLINGAQANNVFWQVGSSATLGGASALEGNVLALTSIGLGTGATVDGRVLAGHRRRLPVDFGLLGRCDRPGGRLPPA